MRFIYLFTIRILFLCLFTFSVSAADAVMPFSDIINLNNNLDLIFSKMKKAGSAEDQNIVRSIWVEGYANNYENGDTKALKSQKIGAFAGLNLLTGKTLIAGAFAGYNLNSFSYGSDKSEDDMNEIEIGVYRATFGEISNSKIAVGYAFDNFNLKNYQDAPKTHNAKLGYDLEFLVPISKGIDLKPFIQAQGAGAYNGAINISSFSVLLSGISYRAQTIAGLRLGDDKNNINWHLSASIGYLFKGRVDFDKNKAGIDTSINASTSGVSIKNPIEFKAEQDLIYGFSAGIEYIFAGSASIFALADYSLSENFNEILVSGGLRFLFGGRKKDADTQKEQGSDAVEKSSDAAASAAPEPSMEEKLKIAMGTNAVQDLGAMMEEPLSNREDSISSRGIPLDDLTTPAGTSRNIIETSNGKSSFFNSANITDTSNMSLVDLPGEEELLSKKIAEDKTKYSNLIKSFILSVAVFKSGGYELTREAKQEIKALADNIRKYKYEKITIEGHSDNSGNPEDNQKLSVLRARAVFGELFLNGIPLEKMEYVGLGASAPISSNSTADGRARNRRVEVFVE